MEFRCALNYLLVLFMILFQAGTVLAEEELSREEFVRGMTSNLQFLEGLEHENAGNYAEAHQWFERAAKQGHVGAQFSLGASFELGRGIAQSFESARYWYEQAANQGDEAAQYFLGSLYVNAHWEGLDYHQARYWFQKSAGQGFAAAQFALGLLYADGHGVRQDYSASKEWFGKACDNGDQEGCNNYRELNIRGF